MFRGRSTRENSSRVDCPHHFSVTMNSLTYFILQTHIGAVVSHSQYRKKSEEVLEKMQVNGPEGYKLARKNSLAVGVACMAIYRPAPGFKGRTFTLWVLNSWVFNFCVRSTPLDELVKVST